MAEDSIRDPGAREVFEPIVRGRSKFAFGYIAAELDLREIAGGWSFP